MRQQITSDLNHINQHDIEYVPEWNVIIGINLCHNCGNRLVSDAIINFSNVPPVKSEDITLLLEGIAQWQEVTS